jgi:ketosteroid isomerase-like protein
MASESVHRRTALSWLAAFDTMDVDKSMSLRSPTCIHHFCPSTLNLGKKNNDEFRAHFETLVPVVERFPVTPVKVFEGGNIVTVHAISEAKFHKEAMDGNPDDWQYHGEYMFVFEMNADGTKIESVLEFLDSAKVMALAPLQERARKNLAARGK